MEEAIALRKELEELLNSQSTLCEESENHDRLRQCANDMIAYYRGDVSPNSFQIVVDSTVLLLENGYHVDEISDIVMQIWKAFTPMVKKCGSMISLSVGKRFMSLLMRYCTEGMETVLRSTDKSGSDFVDSVKLLWLFSQRLAATLVYVEELSRTCLEGKEQFNAISMVIGAYALISEASADMGSMQASALQTMTRLLTADGGRPPVLLLPFAEKYISQGHPATSPVAINVLKGLLHFSKQRCALDGVSLEDRVCAYFVSLSCLGALLSFSYPEQTFLQDCDSLSRIVIELLQSGQPHRYCLLVSVSVSDGIICLY